MTDLLLAEELFLLTHDDESGRQQAAIALEAGLAGALLLDLAGEAVIVADGKRLGVAAGAGPSHPLLAEAVTIIGESDRPRSAAYWVGKLQSAMRPLDTKVGQSLAGRGILAEHRRKVLGMFKTTKWPEVDPEPERALRARIYAVLVDGAEPDPRTALLVPLLLSLRMIYCVAGKGNRRAAEARARQIAKSNETGTAVNAAVSASVQATQTEIMTATIIPATTATTIS